MGAGQRKRKLKRTTCSPKFLSEIASPTFLSTKIPLFIGSSASNAFASSSGFVTTFPSGDPTFPYLDPFEFERPGPTGQSARTSLATTADVRKQDLEGGVVDLVGVVRETLVRREAEESVLDEEEESEGV